MGDRRKLSSAPPSPRAGALRCRGGAGEELGFGDSCRAGSWVWDGGVELPAQPGDKPKSLTAEPAKALRVMGHLV